MGLNLVWVNMTFRPNFIHSEIHRRMFFAAHVMAYGNIIRSVVATEDLPKKKPSNP